jgi:hypothetical protein
MKERCGGDEIGSYMQQTIRNRRAQDNGVFG